MPEVTEERPKTDPVVLGLYVLGTCGFVISSILLRSRPDPLPSQIAGFLSALAMLGAALRDRRPRPWRTFMRIIAGALAVTFVVLAVVTR